MKVCIYARVSTNQQELDAQIETCKKFCEYKGFEIGKIYFEIGSGKEYFNRPKYQEMLKAVRNLEYEGVVVFRFDRLGRNTREAIMFFDEMESRKVQVFSVSESLDTTTAIGRAVRDFILVLAQLERENIAEATRQRLTALKNMGKILGRKKGSKDKVKRKRTGYFLRYAKKGG